MLLAGPTFGLGGRAGITGLTSGLLQLCNLRLDLRPLVLKRLLCTTWYVDLVPLDALAVALQLANDSK